MTKLSNMTDDEKYQHQLKLNRERQRKYYQANKDKILGKKKTTRESNCQQCETAEPELPQNTDVIQRLRTILEADPTVKAGSVKTHCDSLKAFMRITECADLGKCLKSPKKIIDMLENADSNRGTVFSVNSKKAYIEGVIVAITRLKLKIPQSAVKKYDEYFNKLKILSKNQTIEKAISEPVENFNTYLTKAKEVFGATSKQYLLAKVYNEAPLRDDFHRLKIVATDKEATESDTNYIKVPRSGNARVITNKYKTDKRYGVIRIDLTNGLTNLIREYINSNNIRYGEGLFGNSKSLSDFASKMNKSLGYKGGVSLFRNMKVSTELEGKAMNDATLRLELANKMGHAPVTQYSYLRKLIQS